MTLCVIAIAGCSPGISSVEKAMDQLSGAERLLELHRKDLAVKEIDRSIELSPSNLYIYEASFELLRASGYPREGVRYLEKAVKLSHPNTLEANADFSVAFRILGDEYQTEKRLSDAEKAYEKAVELDNSNSGAYNDWAYLYADNGVKLDKAVELAKHAVELQPESGEFLDSLAWAYFRMGNSKKALLHMKKAVELSPSQADLRYHLGMIEESLGDRLSATVEYRKALLLNPGHKQSSDRLKSVR